MRAGIAMVPLFDMVAAAISLSFDLIIDKLEANMGTTG